MLKDMDFDHLLENIKKILDTGLDGSKKQEPVEEIIILLEKKRISVKQIEKSFIKM